MGIPPSRPTRLLVVQDLLAPSYRVFASGLARAFGRREDVTLGYAKGRPPRDSLRQGLAGLKIRSLRTPRELRACLADGAVERIHYHLFGSDYLGGASTLRRWTGELTLTFHQIRSRPPAALLDRADRITCVSRYLRRKLRAVCPSLRREVAVVYNGHDPRQMSRAGPGPGPAGPYALCVGRLSSEKGTDVLLMAFSSLIKKHPGLSLAYVVGNVWPRGPVGWVKGMAGRLGLRDNLFLYQGLDRAEVWGMIKRCAFLVMPSREESFGLAALEAMAMGKAVVASRVGGLSEVVRHRATGYLTRPGSARSLRNAMERLAGDGRLRTRLGRAARAFAARRFTWERIAEDYRRVETSAR